MFIKNKKAVTEIVSFVLITLLIVVSSSIAYYFADDIINQKISELDSKNMINLMNKLDYKFDEIQMYDENSFSMSINFRKGSFVINEDDLYYQSLIDFSGEDYCFSNLCYRGIDGKERVYLTLSNFYEFEDNLTLLPGNYRIYFKNIKNESKIQITIKE